MAPRPSLPALRRYATVAADTVASSSATTAVPSAARPGRVFPERKAFLFDYYNHLLRRSQLVLLFQHANLSVADSNALRNAIASIPVPRPATLADDAPSPEPATLTIARTGLLAPVVRAQPGGAALETHLNGQTALITCPSLSPLYVGKVLAVLARTVKKQQSDDPKKAKTQPALSLVAGVMEGSRVLNAAQVKEFTQLPDLDGLRAQLLGLLETPSRQLVGILSQAGGGSLVRTLQGLEETLKEKTTGDEAK